MGKLERFEICFNNSTTVYRAGDMLSGQVVVVLNQPMKADVVTLKIRGEAYVHWTETRTVGSGDNRRTETVHYSAKEKYYDHKIPLWQKSTNEPKIPRGTHVFPFNFQLTNVSPASYEGDYGYVRYWLKSSIVKPWKFDHDMKVAFTVICHMDLNAIPRAKEAILVSGEDDVGCCTSCSSNPGKFKATLRVDHRGYVPGEQVHTIVEIHNDSAEVVMGFVVLKMYTEFRATSKTKHQDKDLTKTAERAVNQHEFKVWDDYLNLPPLPPTNLGGCNIINIEYFVKVKLRTDAFCSCGSTKMGDEIIIGTVPLNLPRFLPVNMGAFAPSLGPDPGYPPVGPVPGYPPVGPDNGYPPVGPDNGYPPGYPPMGPDAGYPPSAPPPGPSSYNAASAPNPPRMQRQMSSDVPPPSYEECMFVRQSSIRDEEDTEHTRGEVSFAPRYPFYNLHTQPEEDEDPPPGYQAASAPPAPQDMNRL